MAQSALIAAFMAGLLGGLHCIAMCGGYVGALAARSPAHAVEIVHVRGLLVRSLLPNIARIATYAALGALAGAAGSAALGFGLAGTQRVLYVVANVLLLVLAYSIATARTPFAALERVGLGLYRRLIPFATRWAGAGGRESRWMLGFLWGLTPCGLVYGVLPVALLSGTAGDGALVMLAFGLGTLPNLLAAGFLLGRVQQRFRSPAWRHAAGAVVAAFALVGLYRAWFVPAALAHGPFCIAP